MIDYNELFNDSYERISVKSDVFYEMFYQIFVGKSKEIKRLFYGIDMKRQQLMLRQSVVFLIAFYITNKPDEYLNKFAEFHRNNLKIKPDMYDRWMDSLIDTLKVLDNKFDPNVEIAWRMTLSPGIEFMKHYAKE